MCEARAAADLGIHVHSAVDEVLADERARDEVLARIHAEHPAALAAVLRSDT